MQNKNPFSLTGKFALITGGGIGIGFAIAQSYIKSGARIIITGRRKTILEKACKNLDTMLIL